jgi:hypothetical protein
MEAWKYNSPAPAETGGGLDFDDGVPGKFAERFTGTGDCSRRNPICLLLELADLRTRDMCVAELEDRAG